jgi:penicillin-binding protein 1C
MAMLRNSRLRLNKYRIPLRISAGIIFVLIITYFWLKPSQSLLDTIYFSQVVYDRNGKELRLTLSKDEKYRIYAHVNVAGSLLRDATILKEDKYFYYHPGINIASLFRAFYQTYIQGDRKIGGSTITMQVARILFGINTKNIPGKLKQMAAALYLELYYSKDDILEAYINIVPCGGNIEGFAAGALIFFGKELIDLSLQQVLFLAVLPQNPSAFHPKTGYFDNRIIEARERLYGLWKTNYPSQADKAVHLEMTPETQYNIPFHAPHYSNSLLEKYNNSNKIYSTLDLKIQTNITRITQRYIQRNKAKGIYNAAVLLVDSDNMQILASLGSADFFDDKINGQVNGTRSRRSPGSALKPFIYGLAMDQGLIHPMTMLKDTPTSFSSYSPDNFERDFKGPLKATEALITSRNVPAVVLASKINPDLHDFIKKADIGNLKNKDHYGLSIVLGSAEITMEELVALYGILANNGNYQKLNDSFMHDSTTFISSGFLSPEVCYLIKNILSKNPAPHAPRNIWQSAKNLTVAYKTGTSIGFKDCWSIGIFNRFIIAVWLGNFDGYGNPILNGRYMAAPLMFEIIESVLPELQHNEDMNINNIPYSISRVEICDASGQIAHRHCLRKTSTLFIPGKSPITKCSICREIYINIKNGYRTLEKEGKFVKKQVYEFWPTDLLALFRQAGIPRKTPPPFEPAANHNAFAGQGLRPEIVSPLENTEYIIYEETNTYTNLPLKAIFDADVNEVYWFIDGQFIGKAMPDETQYWTLNPGVFNIAVVDDHWRSSHRKIEIKLATN